MTSITRDTTDRKLLNLVQAGFPLTQRPFEDLGKQLGTTGDDVISRIRHLKNEGIIRQISPVVDGRRLGFHPTLVAARIPEDDLPRAEDAIRRHPGVSHGYERDHHFNVWFTLALPAGADVAEAIFPLPATRLFKIGAYFDVGGDGRGAAPVAANPGGALPDAVELSGEEREVLVELQQDIPLMSDPFSGMAARLNMDIEAFLAHCRALVDYGVMRRFGASVNHRQAGFQGNGMVCWKVPPEMVDTAGARLAALPEVSHCYERETNALWRYNIFAMIHGRTRDECRQIAARATSEIGLGDYQVLFSTREFKKERVRYLA